MQKVKSFNTCAISLFSFLMISHLWAYPQAEEFPQKNPSYLSIQSGLTVVYNTIDPEGWWSGGRRFFIEFQKEIKRNFLVGYSYEGMIPFNVKQFEPLTHFICLNSYYKLKLYKTRVFLLPGVGFGGVHHYANGKNEFGIVVNVSLILSIRIIKNTYFEMSPLILTAPMKIYYSPLNFEKNNNLLALPILSFGIKMRI